MPIPELREKDVLVKVSACGVCGSDIPRVLETGTYHFPTIPGHEFGGTIAEAGSGVSKELCGKRVAVIPLIPCKTCKSCETGQYAQCEHYDFLGSRNDGGFAEYVKIPAAAVRSGNIVPLADHVSYAEAAITEALSCVYNGISQCHIRPGDAVVVIGAGPIGMMHAMLAKMSGAGKVFVSDIAQNRLEACKDIDPSFIPVGADVAEVVEKMTGGHGADVVITACPVPSAQQNALKMAANYGRICFFGGLPADRQEVPLNSNLIHYKQRIVTGSTRASLKQFKESLGFVTDGILDVKKLITRHFPLSEIQQGFEYAKAANGLKNIIDMD